MADKGFSVRGLESTLRGLTARSTNGGAAAAAAGGVGGTLVRVPSVALQLQALQGQSHEVVEGLEALGQALLERPLRASDVAGALGRVRGQLGEGVRRLTLVTQGVEGVQVRGRGMEGVRVGAAGAGAGCGGSWARMCGG